LNITNQHIYFFFQIGRTFSFYWTEWIIPVQQASHSCDKTCDWVSTRFIG
jgi:hypothetical protein